MRLAWRLRKWRPFRLLQQHRCGRRGGGHYYKTWTHRRDLETCVECGAKRTIAAASSAIEREPTRPRRIEAAVPDSPRRADAGWPLTCTECGLVDQTGSGRGWRAYAAADDDVEIFCPACARRGFAHETRSRFDDESAGPP